MTALDEAAKAILGMKHQATKEEEWCQCPASSTTMIRMGDWRNSEPNYCMRCGKQYDGRYWNAMPKVESTQ